MNLKINDMPLHTAGRFGRISYLAWVCCSSLCALPFLLLGMLLLNISAGGLSAPFAFIGLASLIFLVSYLILLYFNVVFLIRRLHDFNHSGWLVLLLLIPILNLVLWLYFICAKGTEGTNNYGPQRMTYKWEKRVGIIYIVIFFFSMIASLAIPSDLNIMEKNQQIDINKTRITQHE